MSERSENFYKILNIQHAVSSSYNYQAMGKQKNALNL